MAVTQHQQITGWTGWVGFAGILMTFAGIFHIILGLGGVFGQDWYIYTQNATWMFDSSVWGWTLIVGGALLMLSASLLLAGNIVGRTVAVLIAAASLLANIALFSAAPLWSGLAIFLDVMIIYAVMAHGSEMKNLQDN